MPVRIVQSQQNARLKELRRALGSPRRKADRVAGVEGPHLVEEALRAGLRIQSVFAEENTLAQLEKMPFPPGIEVLVMPPGVLARNLTTETPQAVAALVEIPAWTWENMLISKKAAAPLLMILAGLQDPGNMGTILRSAEAFGASGVIALPGTVDPWNQKVMRASAGSVFRLPFIQTGIDECFDRLRQAGVSVLTTVSGAATPAHEVDFSGPVAFLIGNEGNGVPADLATRADGAVTIPCPGPVESLNASVAASILLYEASRQRRAANRHSHPRSGNRT
jgi:RNA methyltransferase, TrmH family